MKTIILPSPLKALLFAFIVLAASFSMQQVYAQTATLTSMPTATGTAEIEQAAVAKSSKGFQAIAFPTQNKSKIKVIIEDLTGKGTIIDIRNKAGQLVHQMNCSSMQGLYARVFDVSVLPDGEYTLEVIALSSLGFVKEKISHTFKLQSSMERSITPWDKELKKDFLHLSITR